ncbi:unnamed protein product [Didymodactylos carnosus]|uniref:Aquaporin n=1 Tax=Didymodactylos carnosus TaxID=1234261 RepID=A0A815MZZ8_9BILA|nr:unnamed protein product [Didymodactylos carnosus]CAF4310098.1 unnamed protein product [Didymodactylos carnosus]
MVTIIPQHSGPILANPSVRDEMVDAQTPFVQGSNSKRAAEKPMRTVFDAEQFKKLSFYRALLAEFIGTMCLVFGLCSTNLLPGMQPVSALSNILTSGLLVSTLVVCFGHVSGCHINPAVTIALLVGRQIELLRTICYIIMQLLGATCGTLLLKLFAAPSAQKHLCVTMITEGMSIQQAICMEFFATFMLCSTVFAVMDEYRNDVGGSKALTIGLAVSVSTAIGGPYTGASLNPARSFGPALVNWYWTNHWIYWFAPISAGITAAITYNYLLKHRISVPGKHRFSRW